MLVLKDAVPLAILLQCDQIWQNFIVTNGQILKYNLTIWSHCQSSSGGEFQPVPFAFKSNYEWYLQKNYTNILLFKSKNM